MSIRVVRFELRNRPDENEINSKRDIMRNWGRWFGKLLGLPGESRGILEGYCSNLIHLQEARIQNVLSFQHQKLTLSTSVSSTTPLKLMIFIHSSNHKFTSMIFL